MIPERRKYMFDRTKTGVEDDEAVTLELMLIKYRWGFAEHDPELRDFRP